ncbi:hypothetical protein LIER_08855 [Lithospermum erythrorhizon]|uniref:Uncharacterized protein n=1 Tax=Lithospermum erythrorhizon TaxID=34254 RepID=A0AAV3PEU6_LITER
MVISRTSSTNPPHSSNTTTNNPELSSPPSLANTDLQSLMQSPINILNDLTYAVHVLSSLECRGSPKNVLLEVVEEEAYLYEQNEAKDGALAISYLPP